MLFSILNKVSIFSTNTQRFYFHMYIKCNWRSLFFFKYSILFLVSEPLAILFQEWNLNWKYYCIFNVKYLCYYPDIILLVSCTCNDLIFHIKKCEDFKKYNMVGATWYSKFKCRQCNSFIRVYEFQTLEISYNKRKIKDWFLSVRVQSFRGPILTCVL